MFQRSLTLLAVAGLVGTAAAQNPWTNLPTSFPTADGYVDDFESYAGVVPAHMTTHALDAVSYLPDAEAWCNIGQQGACLSATSGIACLEMGLDPASTNYHDVLNGLVIGLDGASAAADLWLDFQIINHGEELDTWDGVWVSDDGINWYQAGGWSGSTTWSHYDDVNLSIVGASTAGQFYLLFAQDDNFPYGYLDGIGVDDLNVDTSGPPPPAILHTEVNPANGHTYHLLESTDWTTAEAAAVSYGGHLATVEDQAENDWIYNTFGGWGGQGRDLWIGYHRDSTGAFVWSSGATSTYTNWAPGQPDNNGGNEDYTHIYGIGSPWYPGQWNDMFNAASAGWSFGYYGVVEISGPTGPQLSVSGLVAGGITTISVSGATPAGLVRHGYSMAGGGPITTAFGDLLLSPPYVELPAMIADANGDASLAAPVPPGTTGISVWLHAFDMGSLSFSNGVAAVIG